MSTNTATNLARHEDATALAVGDLARAQVKLVHAVAACGCGLCGECFARLRDASYARAYVASETSSQRNSRKGSY